MEHAPAPQRTETSSTGRERRRAWLMGLAAGTCLWGLALLAGLTGFGRSLEWLVMDGLWPLRTSAAQSRDLLVVAVDEPSFQEIGLAWPWPRRLHALLLERLHQAGARLVVMDMIFAEASTPRDDQALALALEHAGPVILGKALETVDDPAFLRQVVVEPCPLFARAAADVGLAVLTPDADGAVRRFHTRHGGAPTLAGAALGLLRGGEVPEAGGLIDHPGPARSIDTVSYAQVIDPDRPLPESRIRGRVVVVGRSLAATATPLGQADTFATPLTRTTGLPTSGPEIHAAVIATLLGGGPGREIPLSTALLWAGLLLPAAGALCFSLRPVPAALSGVGLGLAVLGLSAALFAWRFVWLPPALTAAACGLTGGLAAVYRGLVEARQRRFLARAFGCYLSPVVVQDLVARPERLELGGEEVEVTVFFSDLAGFTSFSEKLSPRELIAILNAYFTPATDIILASGGTLDKFIGDAVMAFWGAPLPMPDHGARALGAALAMRRSVEELSRDFAARGLPGLDARMGLHTGPAVVGNVGSRERFNYTILGDTVNLASRLESLNKYYGTKILASQAARDAAGGAFLWREVDRVRVKGRAEAVTVFEPLGEAGQTAPAFAALFAEARRRYLARNFQAALDGFLAADAARPDDAPSRVFAARCRQHLAAPPPEDWDGVFVPEGK